MPQTPEAGVPSKSASTAVSPKGKDDIIQIEDDQSSQGGKTVGAETNTVEADVEVITRKMAEALAHDAIVKGGSSKTIDHSGKSSSNLDDERWQQTYEVVDMLMKDIWGKADQEYDALDRFQNKVAEFFGNHKRMRKVRNFLNHVAPELQGEFSLENPAWCS